MKGVRRRGRKVKREASEGGGANATLAVSQLFHQHIFSTLH